MKKIVVIVSIIAIVLILLISVFIYSIPGTSCELRGGRIVNALEANTLGKEPCESNEINKGEVTGLKCPCVCCVPSK